MQTEIKRVKLDDLKATRKMQTRVALNKEALEDYKRIAKAAKDNGGDPEFGHLIVYQDSFGGEQGDLYLSDGFHRRAAMQHYDIKEFPCEVRISDDAKRDALLNGFKANIAHGVRLTNADKKHNLELALEDKEWVQLSDNELATMLGVSHTFVGANRPKSKSPDKKKTKAGVEIDTTNIGKGGGEVRAKKAKAKKEAKAKKTKPAPEEPRVDKALETAYAKITKVLENGADVVKAIQNGTIPMPRPDILKWTQTSDDRVRKLGELVIGKRWKIKRAIACIDKTVDASTKADHFIGLAISLGGIYCNRVEKSAGCVWYLADKFAISEAKDGTVTISPIKKKK